MKRYIEFPGLVLLGVALVLLVAGPAPVLGAGHDHQGSGGHGSTMAHDHGKRVMLTAGSKAPALGIAIKNDPVGGWNLHLRVSNFRFAPERASTPYKAGEGHAHIYVNGKKLARLYGPWFHIGSLPPGKAMIRVTLNTNDHREMMVGGKIVAATATVVAPKPKH